MTQRFGTAYLLSMLVFAELLSIAGCVSNSSSSTPPPDRSASQWMNLAGHNVGSAAKDTYEGRRTAAGDTAVTTKVKMGLHNDKLTHRDDIHVSTVAGVVTLQGSVQSPEDATRAVNIARSTSSVRSVVNDLVSTPESATEVE
jgi:osmotically-inducible protein OsmY